MIEALLEAGWPAYVVLALAALALLLALAGAIAAFGPGERNAAIGLSIGGIVAALATVGMGALGYGVQMAAAFDAVSAVDPSARAALLAQAISEAMNNLVIGGVCAAPPFLLSVAALLGAVLGRKGAAKVRGD